MAVGGDKMEWVGNLLIKYKNMKSSEGGTGQALRDIPTKETVQETIEQKEQKILLLFSVLFLFLP